MDFPVSFPMQHQDQQPGHEHIMNPPPIYDDAQYGLCSGMLQNKVALITGGDSGIGRAVAIAYAKQGADCAIIYYNEHQDAEDTQKMIEQQGKRCMLLPGDISDEKFCNDAVNKVINEYGTLDILVNNAAVQHEASNLMQISNENFDRTFKVNVYGTFYLTRAALPHLKSGSSIIVTTSVVAFKGNETLIDYSMTKGALTTFVRSLALSLAKQKTGIRVNAVAPGPVWTPLIPSSMDDTKVSTFGSDTPLGRSGQPVECAGAYVFLASEAASYITGQTIHINGGEIVNA